MSVLVYCNAVTINRLQAFSFYMSGNLHLEVMDTGTAVKQLLRAVHHPSTDYVIRREKAYVWLARGLLLEGEHVEPTMRTGLEEYPNSHELAAMWGAIASVDADSTIRQVGFDSIREVEAYSELTRDELAELMATNYQDVAISLIRNGEYERAITASHHSLAYQEKARGFFTLGSALLMLTSYPEAIEAFEMSTRLDADVAEPYHSLGLALEKSGRQEEAEAAYSRASELQ